MENKKTKIISIASIIALALTLVTATFAYFMAQTGEGKSTDIKINANTVDTFTFATGDAISLSMNQQNFASGSGNQTGTTYAKAMLTANNKTNTATEHYYVYLNISENTFTYTQDVNTPELLLTVKDASGNAITSITGLTYKTVTDGKGASVSGFDITTKRGLLTLFDNREITTTSTKTEQWNITATFINYDADQSANAGKSFSAKLIIQKEKMPTVLSDVCTNGNNLATCVTTLANKSDSSIVNIYHHDGTLENGIDDNSYRYAGGSYILTDTGKTTGATMIVTDNLSVTTALIDFYCNGKKQYFGNGCAGSKYFTIKEDTTQYKTYNATLTAAVEKGYLANDNVKNFVCFGSDASSCPTDNLYRIIGVIDGKIKLIKATYANSNLLGTDGEYQDHPYSADAPNEYYWNSNTKTNIWSESNLNKINLNTNFVNNIGSSWSSKIATTTWKVGGNSETKIPHEIPAVAYKYEITNPVENTTYSAKIGLMYISDYGFAAIPNAWTLRLLSFNSIIATSENWMYMGLDEAEWTITRDSEYSSVALYINQIGTPYYMYTVNMGDGFAVRPVFFLESSITYVSGTGTQSDPIRIN